MPTTLEALILFSIFSVPAYVTIAVYKARYPVHYYREKQSPIEQAALYICVGTIANILTIFFLWLLWVFAIPLQNSLPAGAVPILNIPGGSVGESFTATFMLLVVYLATSVVFSFLTGNILGRLLPGEEPLWVTELNNLKVRQAKEAEAIDVTWVLVHLRNGDRCLGLVSEFRWISDQGNKLELALEKAFCQLAGSEKKEKVGRVLLRSDDILWLSPYSE